MNGISMDWFYDTRDVEENLFDKIVASLFENGKITRFSYNIFRVKGVLHPRPVFGLFMHFSQKLQQIGNK